MTQDAQATATAEADAGAAATAEPVADAKAMERVSSLWKKGDAGKAEGAGDGEKATADDADGKDESGAAASEAEAERDQPTGEPKETPADKPAAPTLTQRQRETAEQFGLDAGAVAALGDKAQAVLDRMGKGWDKAVGRLGSRFGEFEGQIARLTEELDGLKTVKAETAKAAPAAPAPATTPEKPAAEAQPLPRFTSEEMELGEGSVADKLNALAEGVERALAGSAQPKAPEDLVGRLDAIEQRAEQVEVDRFWQETAEQAADLYGTGPSADLDPQSAEARMRLDLEGEAEALRRAKASLGQSITRTDALRRAFALEHAGRDKAHAVNAASERAAASARRKAPHAAAGQARTDAMTEEDKAMATVRKIWGRGG